MTKIAEEIRGKLDDVGIMSSDAPREQWLNVRRRGIGGSDIAAIMHMGRFKNKLEVFLDKKGESEQKDPSIAMRVGSHIEPLIAELFAELGPGVEMVSTGVPMIRHADAPHAFANIDAIGIHEWGPCVVEFKSVGAFSRSDWKDEAVPSYYYAQVQWYMGILRSHFPDNPDWFDHAWIGALMGKNKLEVRCVRFDEEWFRSALNHAGIFWGMVEQDMVDVFMDDVDQMPANVFNSVRSAYPGNEDVEKAQLDQSDDNDLLWELQSAIESAKEVDERVKRLRAKVGLLMGDSVRGLSRDFAVSWPVIDGRRKLDLDALKEAHPKVDVDEFYVRGKSYRGGLRLKRTEG
jgi:putative phage-type endonuclease